MNINHARLEIAGESNVGRVMPVNEDNFLIYAPSGGESVLAVIADGIGGHSRGEVASGICCRMMLQAARSTDSSRWDAGFLRRTVEEINAYIFDLNFRSRNASPMGCTLAAALFFRDRLIFAAAGDSRIYEYHRSGRGRPLRQLTTDHRPDWSTVSGRKKDPRHISLVSRSLGTVKHLDFDLREVPRPLRAKYLLCSDGLYKHQPEQMLAGVLGSGVPPRVMTGALLRNAMLAGERDNISVICAATAGEDEDRNGVA